MTTGLRFEQASRRYARFEALAPLDLCCAAGSLTCIIGPNGAGKSTALALASGLVRPTSGRVTWGGVPVTALTGTGTVSFLPQWSVFPRSLRPREILELSRCACSLPRAVFEEPVDLADLGPVLDKPVGTLSGGWVRRLGLACALLVPTTVLLLDEPFVGLDPEILGRLKTRLFERSRDGNVIVFSSHAFDDADDLQPQLVVLQDGHVRAVRPAASVKARALYREVLTPCPDGDRHSETTPEGPG